MSGETDLAKLLRGLDPERLPGAWAFEHRPGGTMVDLPADALGAFREAEGLTVIRPAEGDAPRFACITLRVHSSLEAVGLTAAVATTLAADGIAANVVAAALHDHVFVPEDRAEEALAALRRLAG